MPRKNQIIKPFLPFFYLTLLLSLTANAQYTGVINANNPGFAETPYSVGIGVYQFEANFFSRDTSREPVFASPDSNGFQLQFRTSYFYEKLEFIANLGFQNDEVTFTNIFNSRYFTQGLSSFSLGAKYLFFEQKYKDKSKEIRSWKKRHSFDWRRLLPSMAGYGGINTNLVNKIHQRQSITGRLGLLFQNDINSDFNIVTNVFYDFIGSNQTELSLVVSGTYSLTDRWSTFLEYQNVFREFVNDVNFGSGLAFLYNRNIQINSSLRYLIEGNARGYYASLGVSYRLDRHKDQLIQYDEVGNRIKGNKDNLDDIKEKGKVGKFFQKLNIFKKDPAKKKTKLSQKTLESIKRNVSVDDKTLYITRKENGLPVRTRPKRVRKKPSRLKPIKEKKDPSIKENSKKKKQQEKEDKKKAKAKEKQKRKDEKEARKKAKQKKKDDTEDEKEEDNL